jgi:hypothetical protein
VVSCSAQAGNRAPEPGSTWRRSPTRFIRLDFRLSFALHLAALPPPAPQQAPLPRPPRRVPPPLPGRENAVFFFGGGTLASSWPDATPRPSGRRTRSPGVGSNTETMT